MIDSLLTIKVFHEAGLTVEEIAEKTGTSNPFVTRSLFFIHEEEKESYIKQEDDDALSEV